VNLVEFRIVAGTKYFSELLPSEDLLVRYCPIGILTGNEKFQGGRRKEVS
jgi:hypothetical protein